MKPITLVTIAALGVAAATRAASATVADDHGWKPVFITAPRSVDMQAIERARTAGATLPSFTSQVTSGLDGKTYQFTILGTDPTKAAAVSTIDYVPIAVRWHFPGGVVLDPTMPGCGDTVSVNNRFFNSPLFENTALTSNGINVGNTQVVDGFQRAEFWQYVANKNYHVLLKRVAKRIVVDLNAPAGSAAVAGACSGSNHDVGHIDYYAYDALLQGLIKKYTTGANQLPIIMSYNIVETQFGVCCIIGYHGVVNNNGVQPYATGAYTDGGIFGGIQDIHAWVHEIGELFNDPYVNNATPAWGHIGQVQLCQNNFEVGDPLTGHPFLDTLHGFTYHPQELAFFSWFYRSPASGTAGKYSFEGSFTSTQGVCQ